MRDKLIDVARGIGILLVVFAHIYEGIATNIIYLFHMPLFFFLSGATISFSKSQFDRNYVNKRIKTLLVPYFLFSLISFFYWWRIESYFRPSFDSPIFDGIMGNLSMPIQQFINIFLSISFGSAFVYNSPLWFLTCLFISIVCYTLIKKYIGKYSFFCCCLSAALYFSFLRVVGMHLPWCFEIALTTLPLLWLGDNTYKRIRMSTSIEAFFISIVSLIISFSIVLEFHPSVNMKVHHFGTWWQFYLCSVSLIAILLIFGRLVLKYEFGVLQWLGRNSLIIMCIHGPINRIVLYAISVIIQKDVDIIRHSLLMSSCTVLLDLMIVIPVVIIINRYFPWVWGKTRLNNDISKLCN